MVLEQIVPCLLSSKLSLQRPKKGASAFPLQLPEEMSGLVKARNLRSSTVVEDNLIPTEVLTLAHVPPPDAKLELLEEFCLTIDGYQGERYSIEYLLLEAERVQRVGLENATMDELRIAAFIRQRELRWTTHGDEVADAPLIRKIRDLVREIRRRL